MQYISTRDTLKKTVSSAQAIRSGLAPDGGLYVPENFPAYQPTSWSGLDYRTLAGEIFALYLTDFSPGEIDDCVSKAYAGNFPSEVCPLVTVGYTEVLELFHGPTSAFKDMALQALPHLLRHSMSKCDGAGEAIILTATSGDTGKAALEGFRDVPGVRIIVFYPQDGVSNVQKLQMASTTGSNVHVISVAGNFDTCQQGVKALFADTGLKERMSATGFEFSSANSINFGRLLPQIVYYYYSYGRMVEKGVVKAGEEIQVIVPSGNFGNILAAYYAKCMGLPVGRLVCASNINNVLTEVIYTGRYNRVRPFYKTTSPSMDILVSSNFERFLFEMYERDAVECYANLQALDEKGEFVVSAAVYEAWGDFLTAGFAKEEEVSGTIRDVFEKYGYLLDPHTAVGWRALRLQKNPLPSLLVATASPYKFAEAVLTALGHETSGMAENERQYLLARISGTETPLPLAGIGNLPILHSAHTSKEDMKAMIESILSL